jgi:hypothetical protein
VAVNQFPPDCVWTETAETALALNSCCDQGAADPASRTNDIGDGTTGAPT